MNLFRDNLRAAWDRIKPEDVEHGAPAYRHYNATIQALGDKYNVPLATAALAFVILSPHNTLRGNLRGLATCLEAEWRGLRADQFKVSGFGRWRVRAMDALNGTVLPHHIKGPKIVAFYDNILRHDQSLRVCVDGHMICVASGQDMSMADAQRYARHLGYATTFRMVEKAVVALAIEERLPPCAVQAILWTARKREKGILADEWPQNRPIAPDEIELFELPRMEGKNADH